MYRTQVYLTEEQREALRKLAERLDCSQSEPPSTGILAGRQPETGNASCARVVGSGEGATTFPTWARCARSSIASLRRVWLTFNRRHYPMIERLAVPYPKG